MHDDKKAATVVLVISLLLATISITALMLSHQGEDIAFTPPVLTIYGKDGKVKYLGRTQIAAMNYVEGFSVYENRFNNWRDPGTYRGVKISDLVELVGGMSNTDIIEVIASDGYCQNFTYANVYPNSSWYAIQGDMILSYSYNETSVPDWADGYRIAFLPPDGNYSNADALNTSSLEPLPTSAGERWVKNVAEIHIISPNTSTNPSVDSSLTRQGGEAELNLCASYIPAFYLARFYLSRRFSSQSF